jgi:hypothetical protein
LRHADILRWRLTYADIMSRYKDVLHQEAVLRVRAPADQHLETSTTMSADESGQAQSNPASPGFAEGFCTCGAVRYRMTTPPLFVHCCHCRWCQRETGTAFALNALIEAERVVIVQGVPEVIDTPSASGKGQRIARCPACHVALWSNYSGAGDAVRFVRVGTLATPDLVPPDIHIFTASKQPWVVLPAGTPAMAEYYDYRQYWPEASRQRRREMSERRRARPA